MSSAAVVNGALRVKIRTGMKCLNLNGLALIISSTSFHRKEFAFSEGANSSKSTVPGCRQLNTDTDYSV